MQLVADVPLRWYEVTPERLHHDGSPAKLARQTLVSVPSQGSPMDGQPPNLSKSRSLVLDPENGIRDSPFTDPGIPNSTKMLT